MTSKDYIRAASIVSRVKTGSNAPLLAWQVRESFVELFAGDNPRFNADKFREACGPVANLYKPPAD